LLLFTVFSGVAALRTIAVMGIIGIALAIGLLVFALWTSRR
jgi:hypothetical protein